MEEYQRYQKSTDQWIDIYNCPIKEFRKKYPRCKTRLKPVYPILQIAKAVIMINKFLSIN
jgi:hypothetical protein